MILVIKDDPTHHANLGSAFLSFDPKVNFKTPKPFMENNPGYRKETLNDYTKNFGIESKNMRLTKKAIEFSPSLFFSDFEWDLSSIGPAQFDYIEKTYTTSPTAIHYEHLRSFHDRSFDVNFFEAVREEYLNRKMEQVQQADLDEMEQYTEQAEKNSKKSILKKLLGD